MNVPLSMRRWRSPSIDLKNYSLVGFVVIMASSISGGVGVW